MLSGPKLTIYGFTAEKKKKHLRNTEVLISETNGLYKFTEKLNLFLVFPLVTALKCIEAFLKSQVIHNFNFWIL